MPLQKDIIKESKYYIDIYDLGELQNLYKWIIFSDTDVNLNKPFIFKEVFLYACKDKSGEPNQSCCPLPPCLLEPNNFHPILLLTLLSKSMIASRGTVCVKSRVQPSSSVDKFVKLQLSLLK